MTLVVARIIGDRVAIASDTRLTKQGQCLPVQQGVIKSCMLPGEICVSFANSPDSAANEFQRFVATYPQGIGFAEAVSFFECSSNRTGNDYIIAFSRQPRIVKISEGRRIISTSRTQWIGDKNAYERFREYEAKQRNRSQSGRAVSAVLFADESENSPASDLYSTMRHVIADPGIPSAGGFVCVVSNREGGFRHSVYSDMLFDWPEGENDDFALELEHKIDLGASGENADFALAQISAGFPGLNVVAYYWLSGRKIFLYYSIDNGLARNCLVIRNVDADNISTKLTESLGIDCRWLLIVMSAAKERARTSRRPLSEQTTADGVGFSMFCHANTFPKSTNRRSTG